MTIGEYFICWGIVLAIYSIGTMREIFGISGYWIYLYIGSVSLAAIYLLVKYVGKNELSLSLCIIELLAIILQPAALYANLAQESNWFHAHYKEILHTLFQVEIAILSIMGVYGFSLLAYRKYKNDPNDEDDRFLPFSTF